MSDLNNKNIELIKKQLEQILNKQDELEKRLFVHIAITVLSWMLMKQIQKLIVQNVIM